ncbi:hypothetical protein [Konateibacter massiliensis]|uniref:hypothetical protein n=1 Tax=Konateibacter massiliensis TaxID=2002841 RepID=UPI000C15FEF0|nr:hypothetical protein [Konateibacter massiliensis]
MAQEKSNRRVVVTAPSKSTEIQKIRYSKDEEPNFYKCPTCSTNYTKLDDNFPSSQSELYAGWNYHLPICKKCTDKLFEHYTTAYGGDEDAAIRRMCEKYDIYYSSSLLSASRKITKNRSRIHSYISKSNLTQYSGKTYDTTLDEERVEGVIETLDDIKDSKKAKLKTVKFFGIGFDEDDYVFLEDEYLDWTTRHECSTKSQEEVFKQICYAQLDILKAKREGLSTKDLTKTFQDLLATANLQPKQTKDNTLAEQNTFGTLIRKWENEKPIPEPDPEWKDVDGIVKYITVYFLGHLCKMMGIKNTYSRMYEDEMEKYKVNKPEYEDDDEALFDAVFGGELDDSN